MVRKALLLAGIVLVVFIALIYSWQTPPTEPGAGLIFRLRYPPADAHGEILYESSFQIVDSTEWVDAEQVFVALSDSAGYAHIDRISMFEPEGTPYLPATPVALSRNQLRFQIRLGNAPSSSEAGLLCARVLITNGKPRLTDVKSCD